MVAATAKLMTSDYGRPKGNVTAVKGRQNVFQREFETATVTLDCNNWSAQFLERP